jgi:hypothetical protein
LHYWVRYQLNPVVIDHQLWWYDECMVWRGGGGKRVWEGVYERGCMRKGVWEG